MPKPKQWNLYALKIGGCIYYAWVNEHDIVIHARSVTPTGHIYNEYPLYVGLTRKIIIDRFDFRKVPGNRGLTQKQLSEGVLL